MATETERQTEEPVSGANTGHGMRFGGFFFWQLVRALTPGGDENMALFGASVNPNTVQLISSISIAIRCSRPAMVEDRRYRCGSCPRSFQYMAHLTVHERIHSKVRPYMCPECGKQFIQSGQVARHVNGVHRRARPYVCELCGARFVQSGALDTHLKGHRGEWERCEDCGKEFSHVWSLKRHRKVHEEVAVEEDDVEEVVQSAVGVESLEVVESTNLVVQEIPEETNDVVKAGRTTKLLPCDVCGRSYTSWYLKIHKRGHSGERPFQCELCLKCFKRPNELKTHLRRHSGERPFRCSICFKQFTLSGQLKKHERVHSGETPYECGVCGKKFKRWGHLRSHRRLHNPVELFNCDQCSRQYTQAAQLKIHLRKHLQMRTYSCGVCDKSYFKPSILKAHLNCHVKTRTLN
ncbi:hypothetical protein quinque_010967 [Culex quinquefasciatus]